MMLACLGRAGAEQYCMRASVPVVVSSWARVHLLHWHAANCITLSEVSSHARARRLLRQLATDLLLEAETQRTRPRVIGRAPAGPTLIAAE
jgi:hypothetical protein